jgi:hypothetical protein
MLLIMVVWLTYALAAVIQLFTSGSKVLESLPPFYFWGIPIAPYTALYTPWKSGIAGLVAGQQPPEAPPAPPTPEAAT